MNKPRNFVELGASGDFWATCGVGTDGALAAGSGTLTASAFWKVLTPELATVVGGLVDCLGAAPCVGTLALVEGLELLGTWEVATIEGLHFTYCTRNFPSWISSRIGSSSLTAYVLVLYPSRVPSSPS